MNLSSSAVPVRAGDELMTAERHEHKYLVPRERLPGLTAELERELQSHRFSGENANRLSGAQHYVTTLYFDTPSRVHYRAATASIEANLKLRAKEYYDVHPCLAELATRPEHIVRRQPWLWFEMKRREGDRTLKQRVRIPKRRIPELIGSEPFAAVDSLASELRLSDAERTALEALAAYCRGLDEPLTELCLVNYRRFAWQSADSSLRVTLDVGVSYYPAPEHVWNPERLLVRSSLGPPSGALPEALIEVKWRTAPPPWLNQALHSASARPVPFSKFVAASESVYGRLGVPSHARALAP